MSRTRTVRPERTDRARADDEVATHGEISTTRVWAEVKVTLRPAEYEGITVTMGEARDCEDSRKARRKTAQEILDECHEKVHAVANEIKDEW